MAKQTATDIKTPVSVDWTNGGGITIRDAFGNRLLTVPNIWTSENQFIADAINNHATLLTENAELKAKLEEVAAVLESIGHLEGIDLECYDRNTAYWWIVEAREGLEKLKEKEL